MFTARLHWFKVGFYEPQQKGVLTLLLKCLETAFGTALQNLNSWIGYNETDFVGKNMLTIKKNPNQTVTLNQTH